MMLCLTKTRLRLLRNVEIGLVERDLGGNDIERGNGKVNFRIAELAAADLVTLTEFSLAVDGRFLIAEFVPWRLTNRGAWVLASIGVAGTRIPIRAVLDARGRAVLDAVDEWSCSAEGRAWWSNRVPASDCPHYIAASEAAGGYLRCERCPGPARADGGAS